MRPEQLPDRGLDLAELLAQQAVVSCGFRRGALPRRIQGFGDFVGDALRFVHGRASLLVDATLAKNHE
jgi:hypothetical protein